MKNTATNQQQQAPVITDDYLERILFDIMYRKRIGFTDWLYTKLGATSLFVMLYYVATDSATILTTVLWLSIVLYFTQRSTILIHKKDVELWGKIALSNFMDRLEEKKKPLNRNETDAIIKECQINKPIKRKLNRKRRAI